MMCSMCISIVIPVGAYIKASTPGIPGGTVPMKSMRLLIGQWRCARLVAVHVYVRVAIADHPLAGHVYVIAPEKCWGHGVYAVAVATFHVHFIVAACYAFLAADQRVLFAHWPLVVFMERGVGSRSRWFDAGCRENGILPSLGESRARNQEGDQQRPPSMADMIA